MDYLGYDFIRLYRILVVNRLFIEQTVSYLAMVVLMYYGIQDIKSIMGALSKENLKKAYHFLENAPWWLCYRYNYQKRELFQKNSATQEKVQ